MNTKKLLLVTFAIVFVFLAIATFIPSPDAHRISVIGYKSFCSFTPISTIILFVFAGISYLGARKVGIRRN